MPPSIIIYASLKMYSTSLQNERFLLTCQSSAQDTSFYKHFVTVCENYMGTSGIYRVCKNKWSIQNECNSYIESSWRGGNSPKISPSCGRAWAVSAGVDSQPMVYTTRAVRSNSLLKSSNGISLPLTAREMGW